VRPGGYLETPLVQLEFLEPQLRDFLFDLCWIPGREGGQPEGLQSREGVHFLGLCRLRGMRVCWLELLKEFGTLA
jgi:hypothetical protein